MCYKKVETEKIWKYNTNTQKNDKKMAQNGTKSCFNQIQKNILETNCFPFVFQPRSNDRCRLGFDWALRKEQMKSEEIVSLKILSEILKPSEKEL